MGAGCGITSAGEIFRNGADIGSGPYVDVCSVDEDLYIQHTNIQCIRCKRYFRYLAKRGALELNAGTGAR